MDAETKLTKVILKRMRAIEPEQWTINGKFKDADHLRECMDAWVDNPQYQGGFCGEGTCEWTVLQAIVACPHGKKIAFEYESYDTVDELFAEMDQV